MQEEMIMEFKTTKLSINKEIFNRLFIKVYMAERENFKTAKLRANEMNDRIRQIIDKEVSKDAD
jgi:hypothetical protein